MDWRCGVVARSAKGSLQASMPPTTAMNTGTAVERIRPPRWGAMSPVATSAQAPGRSGAAITPRSREAGLGRVELDGDDRGTPVKPEHGRVGTDYGEVEGEDFHVVAPLGGRRDAEDDGRVSDVGRMKDVDSPREHDGPGRGIRNGPEAVAPWLEQLSLYEDVFREADGGGRVGAGMPDLVPGDQF